MIIRFVLPSCLICLYPIQPMPTFTQTSFPSQPAVSQTPKQTHPAQTNSTEEKYEDMGYIIHSAWSTTNCDTNADHNLWKDCFSKGTSPRDWEKMQKENTIVHPPVSQMTQVAGYLGLAVRLFGGNEESKKMKKTSGMLQQQKRPDNDDINLKFLRPFTSSVDFDDKARYSAFKVTEVKTDEPKPWSPLIQVNCHTSYQLSTAAVKTRLMRLQQKVYGMMAGLHRRIIVCAYGYSDPCKSKVASLLPIAGSRNSPHQLLLVDLSATSRLREPAVNSAESDHILTTARSSSVYFNNMYLPDVYDPMYINKGRRGTAVKSRNIFSRIEATSSERSSPASTNPQQFALGVNKRHHFWGSRVMVEFTIHMVHHLMSIQHSQASSLSNWLVSQVVTNGFFLFTVICWMILVQIMNIDQGRHCKNYGGGDGTDIKQEKGTKRTSKA
ncbi:hypothetical protein Tco_1176916 [Tanacetum coccineum]